jgi:nucleotide-binding universal stress UspA family protein
MHANQILVPIDFSETSRTALQEADVLAVANPQAHLTLLHVQPMVETAIMDTSFVQPAEKLSEVVQLVEQRLGEWASRLKTPRSQISTQVVTGNPTGEIVEASQHNDLIIMGTHGRAGLGHFLMGSVSERVVQGASCSVLIVKKRANHPATQAGVPAVG